MKQFFVILLALLHLASSSGASVRMHYCMGKFVDAKMAAHTDDDDGHVCGKCGMEKTPGNDCCKEKHKFIKDVTDKVLKQSAQLSFQPEFSPALPVQSFQFVQSSFVYAALQAAPVANAPPDDGPAVPIYLKIRNLRI